MPEITQRLVAWGAKAGLTSRSGSTLLMIAARRSSGSVDRVLSDSKPLRCERQIASLAAFGESTVVVVEAPGRDQLLTFPLFDEAQVPDPSDVRSCAPSSMLCRRERFNATARGAHLRLADVG